MERLAGNYAEPLAAFGKMLRPRGLPGPCARPLSQKKSLLEDICASVLGLLPSFETDSE
jgi:hypothetical protein